MTGLIRLWGYSMAEFDVRVSAQLSIDTFRFSDDGVVNICDENMVTIDDEEDETSICVEVGDIPHLISALERALGKIHSDLGDN